MRITFRWTVAFFLSMAVAKPYNVPAREAPPPAQVLLKAGILEGIRFGSAPNGIAFLGIPYAAPPPVSCVGNHRSP